MKNSIRAGSVGHASADYITIRVIIGKGTVSFITGPGTVTLPDGIGAIAPVTDGEGGADIGRGGICDADRMIVQIGVVDTVDINTGDFVAAVSILGIVNGAVAAVNIGAGNDITEIAVDLSSYAIGADNIFGEGCIMIGFAADGFISRLNWNIGSGSGRDRSRGLAVNINTVNVVIAVGVSRIVDGAAGAINKVTVRDVTEAGRKGCGSTILKDNIDSVGGIMIDSAGSRTVDRAGAGGLGRLS